MPNGAEQLYHLHPKLLKAAQTLIEECPCQQGCPACVGPDGMVGENGKEQALELLALSGE